MASKKMFILAMLMLIVVAINIIPGSFAVPIIPDNLESENRPRRTILDEDVPVHRLLRGAKFGPGSFRRPWGSGWAWSDLM
ncbi:unnamed protein product [Rotaria sordida]|uniref:Uncharacterized protein n=1 Tax=Rotaria sordida TaxID=392033 RepID=A0A814UX16_9BILA|nr:unnamed protein product [Rotaria sordida]